MKPRKKSLLSSLFKNVKHHINYYDGPKWKPDYKIRNEKWQEKNKKIETLTPANLVKIKALKEKNKRSRVINSMIGQLSDIRMINKHTGKNLRLRGFPTGTRFKVHSDIKKPLL